MIQLPTYPKVCDPAKLLDALFAALPATRPAVVDGRLTPQAAVTTTPDGQGTVVFVPPGVAPADVDAVVQAHDPTVPSAAQQQAAQDATDLSAFQTALQTALSQTTTAATNVATAQTQLAGATWDTLTATQRTQAMTLVLNNQALLLATQQRLLRVLAAAWRRLGP